MVKKLLALILLSVGLGCTARPTGPPPFETVEEAFDVWSRTACEAAEACNCEAASVPQTCEETFDATWVEIRALAKERELRFSEACFTTLIDRAKHAGCELPELPWLGSSADGPCPLYFGDRQLGESCTAGPLFHDCAEDAHCFLGVCVGDPTTIAEGDPCEPPDACEQGLVCKLSAQTGELNGVCGPAVAEGGRCSIGECEPGLLCDQQADPPTCVPFPGLGEPCGPGLCQDSRCDTSVDPPTCGPLLDDGAPCQSGFDCKVGSECTRGVCAAVKPIVCTMVEGPVFPGQFDE